MWDVKLKDKSRSLAEEISFISTMWDVKYYAPSVEQKFDMFYLDYVGCKAFIVIIIQVAFK